MCLGGHGGGDVHIHEGASDEAFVGLRTRREATLAMPRLILPSIQIDMRGGRMPEPDDNGVSYLKLPINRFERLLIRRPAANAPRFPG
jgi:hypothetical protein